MSCGYTRTPDITSNSSGVTSAARGRCPKDRLLGKAVSRPPSQEASTALVQINGGVETELCDGALPLGGCDLPQGYLLHPGSWSRGRGKKKMGLTRLRVQSFGLRGWWEEVFWKFCPQGFEEMRRAGCPEGSCLTMWSSLRHCQPASDHPCFLLLHLPQGRNYGMRNLSCSWLSGAQNWLWTSEVEGRQWDPIPWERPS